MKGTRFLQEKPFCLVFLVGLPYQNQICSRQRGCPHYHGAAGESRVVAVANPGATACYKTAA